MGGQRVAQRTGQHCALVGSRDKTQESLGTMNKRSEFGGWMVALSAVPDATARAAPSTELTHTQKAARVWAPER